MRCATCTKIAGCHWLCLPVCHTHHPSHTAAASTAPTAAAATVSQKYLTAARSSSQVTAVLFGSPNVGDAAFADDFNSRVDTRNIEFQNDMVAQVRGLRVCVGGGGGLIHAEVAPERLDSTAASTHVTWSPTPTVTSKLLGSVCWLCCAGPL